ncbi:sensor histidine kinase [Sphingomonas endolithica]|uniref:sensor histidine kinase n=1 Tax=Sphingomonas endolithica TaxID=2972485 RepID=UPI0021AF2048|nr:sensor histidine kinase [Sphingomonas sp. ZFBP2030]
MTKSAPTDQTESWLRRIVDVRGPWVWLAYLPLFGAPWINHRPSAIHLAVSLAGLIVFLALYIWADGRKGRAVILPAILALLLSFALIPFHGNWTVLTVYAVSIAVELRPARAAWRMVALFVAASMMVATLIGLSWYFIVMMGVFQCMVAISKIFGLNLGEKNADLVRAQEEVRRLSRDAERERIARDLHDLLGRTLTLIALKADLAVKLTGPDPEKARAEMVDIADAARTGLADVRAAVAGMAHASLARELQASRVALAAGGVACEVDGAERAIAQSDSAVLAMALREAVTNVIRHAGARHCRISVDEDRGVTSVTVRDDGQGGHFREGAGLAGMRARLPAAGGALTIHADTSGTRVCALLPGATG